MKCRIMKMHVRGVAVSKYEYSRQVQWSGDLVISDMREDGLNRHVKVAKHSYRFGAQMEACLLYEPHLLWVNEDRFALTGFERVLESGKLVDYAQSWLCTLEPVTQEANDEKARDWRR
jgi:hypothetical protein